VIRACQRHRWHLDAGAQVGVSGAKRIPGGMGLARTISRTRPRPRRTEVVFRMRKLAQHRSWRAYPGWYDSGTGTQVATALELAQVWTSCGRRVGWCEDRSGPSSNQPTRVLKATVRHRREDLSSGSPFVAAVNVIQVHKG
jgi:hypothetical protein